MIACHGFKRRVVLELLGFFSLWVPGESPRTQITKKLLFEKVHLVTYIDVFFLLNVKLMNERH